MLSPRTTIRPDVIERHVWDMVINWLAAGVDPAQATLFVQSRVPAHAELHVLAFHGYTARMAGTRAFL